jgi:hypothetical protein
MRQAPPDPIAVIRDTPLAMRRASEKLAERAGACDDPIIAAELQRAASRCARRAVDLQEPSRRVLSLVDVMTRPPR